MKSLETVNRNIESINDQLNDYDEDDEKWGFYPTYDTLMYKLNELEIIKQDLEILEILKRTIKFTYNYLTNEIIVEGRDYDRDTIALSHEEFEKVKQWLEE